MPPKRRVCQGEPSQQEKKAAKLQLQKQRESIEHCLHVLNILNDRPQLWPRPEFKAIRDSVSFIRINTDLFPSIAGDIVPDARDTDILGKTPFVNDHALTKNYVRRLANNISVNEVASPIFQVASSQKKFEVTTAHRIAGKNSIHFTHLRLLNGSGDVMVERCNMNLAHDGNKLRAGEMVQLHLFTPLTYVMSSSGEQGRSSSAHGGHPHLFKNWILTPTTKCGQSTDMRAGDGIM
jgi:hypothetical protein